MIGDDIPAKGGALEAVLEQISAYKAKDSALKDEAVSAALRRTAQEEFGIKRPDRYVILKGESYPISNKMSWSCELLEESVQNLSPEHKPDLPVAVAIVGKADPNGAFSNVGNLLASLNGEYKLLIFECETKEEAHAALKKAAYLNGTDERGAPRKGVDLLILAGHGTKDSLCFGGISEVPQKNSDVMELRPSERLTSADREYITEMGKLLTEKSKIVLVSCSTKEGGAQGAKS